MLESSALRPLDIKSEKFATLLSLSPCLAVRVFSAPVRLSSACPRLLDLSRSQEARSRFVPLFSPLHLLTRHGVS